MFILHLSMKYEQYIRRYWSFLTPTIKKNLTGTRHNSEERVLGDKFQFTFLVKINLHIFSFDFFE